MTEHTDEDLALMDAEGVDRPGHGDAREVFAALDRVPFALWMIYADVLDLSC